MTSPYFVLVDREVIPADLETWAIYFGTSDRTVALTEVAPGLKVSTVFLGVDHRFTSKGPPLLFETITFDDYGEAGEGFARWSTYAEAEAGHAAICERWALGLAEDPDWRPRAPQGRS